MPLTLYRRGRFIKSAMAWSVAIAVYAAAALADYNGWLLARGGDTWRYHRREFRVSQVLSGDSLKVGPVDGAGAAPAVRLCGINGSMARSPVGAKGRGGQSEPSVAPMRRLVERRVVRLSLAPQGRRDSNDRLVAYVYLLDGTMLNEQLLAFGAVRVDDDLDHPHSARFRLIQMQAQRDAVGIWARDAG